MRGLPGCRMQIVPMTAIRKVVMSLLHKQPCEVFFGIFPKKECSSKVCASRERAISPRRWTVGEKKLDVKPLISIRMI